MVNIDLSNRRMTHDDDDGLVDDGTMMNMPPRGSSFSYPYGMYQNNDNEKNNNEMMEQGMGVDGGASVASASMKSNASSISSAGGEVNSQARTVHRSNSNTPQPSLPPPGMMVIRYNDQNELMTVMDNSNNNSNNNNRPITKNYKQRQMMSKRSTKKKNNFWLIFISFIAFVCIGVFGVGIYLTTKGKRVDNNSTTSDNNNKTPSPVYFEIRTPQPTPLRQQQQSPTNAPTLRPVFSPTPAPITTITTLPPVPATLPPIPPSGSSSNSISFFSDDFETYLLNNEDEEFYWIELLNYRNAAVYEDGGGLSLSGREADQIYQDWIRDTILPSMTTKEDNYYYESAFRDPSYEYMIVIRYPSGREFYDKVWKSPIFESMIRHRRAGLLLPSTSNKQEEENGIKYSTMMATKLSTNDVPVVLQQPPPSMDSNNEPFLFLHLVHFNDQAVYPNDDNNREDRTGREAMKKFDKDSASLKSRYGIRAAGWFDVVVPKAITASSVVYYDEVRLEYVPSLSIWGSMLGGTQQEGDAELVSQVWIHREAALEPSISRSAILATSEVESLPNWYNREDAPTTVITISTTPAPTPISTTLPPTMMIVVDEQPAITSASSFFSSDLEKFLLETSVDDDFYWIELLNYRDVALYSNDDSSSTKITGREADSIYQDWIKNDVLPSINEEYNDDAAGEWIHKATTTDDVLYDEIIIIHYPSGKAFYDYVWNSPSFVEMIQHRQAGINFVSSNNKPASLMMTTKLLIDETDVPAILQQYPSNNENQFLFLHLLQFRDVAVYPEGDALSRSVSGREAMSVFDELSAPLKARYGIGAAGWFDVAVPSATISSSKVDYDQIRLEYVPSIAGWGALLGGTLQEGDAELVPDLWKNRDAALNPITSLSARLESGEAEELPHLYDYTFNVTTATTAAAVPMMFDAALEEFLLNELAEDEEFYWIELLNYKNKESDTIYQNWIINEVLPSINNNNNNDDAELIYQGQLKDLSYKDIIIIRYPSGRAFYDNLWKSPSFEEKIQYRYDGLIFEEDDSSSNMMISRLLVDDDRVPEVLQQPPPPPLSRDAYSGDPFLFLHLVQFREQAIYPSVQEQELFDLTGREAMQRFDDLSAPVKAQYGIRAAGWFDVLYTFTGPPYYDEIRLEYVPSLGAWGVLLGGQEVDENGLTVPQIWTNREAAVDPTDSISAILFPSSIGKEEEVILPNLYND